jgi:hypothetical protein
MDATSSRTSASSARSWRSDPGWARWFWPLAAALAFPPAVRGPVEWRQGWRARHCWRSRWRSSADQGRRLRPAATFLGSLGLAFAESFPDPASKSPGGVCCFKFAPR